jgi:hemerythrin-like domain-containing protein
MSHHQAIFTSEAGRIHHEHVELRNNLAALDQSLDRLRCDSEQPDNMLGAAEVIFLARQFGAYIPSHFEREEEILLDKVATVSDELMELAAELKQEHCSLRVLLKTFVDAADGLHDSDDVIADVTRTKLLGRAFTSQFTRHISSEETELAGFL